MNTQQSNAFDQDQSHEEVTPSAVNDDDTTKPKKKRKRKRSIKKHSKKHNNTATIVRPEDQTQSVVPNMSPKPETATKRGSGDNNDNIRKKAKELTEKC